MSSTGPNYTKDNPSSDAEAAGGGHPVSTARPLAVISDFDDTVAVENVAELLLAQFSPDLTWQQLRQQSRDKHISLKEYQERAFEAVAASREEMQAAVKEKATLRPHFKELRDYTRRAGIPLAIVSIGLDFYVDALLAREGLEDTPRYTAGASFSGGTISYSYPYLWDGSGAATQEVCSQWGTCKCSILNRYKQKGYAIYYVGDGRSDMCPASLADHIFARSYLAELCQEKQLPFTPFETFMDVIRVLQARCGAGPQ